MATNLNVRTSYSVVIVGGGAGGVSVAARLKRMSNILDVAVVDPSEFHYYQPAWTLVGGGQFDIAKTRRSMRDCMPAGVEFVPGRVTAFEPEHNAVVLEGGARIGYKFLVVAAGSFGLTTAVNYSISGQVDWLVAAEFVGGGVVGGLLGTRAASHLSRKRGALNLVFSAMIISVAAYMLYHAWQAR